MTDFKTPSGYTLVIKRNFLTFGEKLELKKIYAKAAKVKYGDIKNTTSQGFNPDKIDFDFDFSSEIDVNNKLFEFIVAKLITPEGETIDNNVLGYVMTLKEEIGQEIYDQFNEATKSISKQNQTSGKKNS